MVLPRPDEQMLLAQTPLQHSNFRVVCNSPKQSTSEWSATALNNLSGLCSVFVLCLSLFPLCWHVFFVFVFVYLCLTPHALPLIICLFCLLVRFPCVVTCSSVLCLFTLFPRVWLLTPLPFTLCPALMVFTWPSLSLVYIVCVFLLLVASSSFNGTCLFLRVPIVLWLLIKLLVFPTLDCTLTILLPMPCLDLFACCWTAYLCIISCQ